VRAIRPRDTVCADSDARVPGSGTRVTLPCRFCQPIEAVAVREGGVGIGSEAFVCPSSPLSPLLGIGDSVSVSVGTPVNAEPTTIGNGASPDIRKHANNAKARAYPLGLVWRVSVWEPRFMHALYRWGVVQSSPASERRLYSVVDSGPLAPRAVRKHLEVRRSRWIRKPLAERADHYHSFSTVPTNFPDAHPSPASITNPFPKGHRGRSLFSECPAAAWTRYSP